MDNTNINFPTDHFHKILLVLTHSYLCIGFWEYFTTIPKMFILLCHWNAPSHPCHYDSDTPRVSPIFTSGFSISPLQPQPTSTPLLMPPPNVSPSSCLLCCFSVSATFLFPPSYPHRAVVLILMANLALPLPAFSSTSQSPLISLSRLFSLIEGFNPSISVYQSICQTPPGFTSLSVSPRPTVSHFNDTHTSIFYKSWPLSPGPHACPEPNPSWTFPFLFTACQLQLKGFPKRASWYPDECCFPSSDGTTRLLTLVLLIFTLFSTAHNG